MTCNAGTCSSTCTASPCDIGCYNVCPNGQGSAATCPAGTGAGDDGAFCETQTMTNPGASGCETFCRTDATCTSSTVKFFSLEHITGPNEGYICRCYTSNTKTPNTSPGGSGCPGNRGILSTAPGDHRNTEEMYQI
jgi:hypothetical protein